MTSSVIGAAGATSHMRDVGGFELFYLDAPGASDATPIVLLHGLSANANSFAGVISAGLAPAHRVIAPDLRGRARSGKPEAGYEMADHARDIVALLDALGLERVVLAGHSFGGYLGIFIAATYPARVERLVVIDAAISSHPRIPVLLKPSLDRLGRTSPSAEAYLAEVRSAPYMQGIWDENAESYFRAELTEHADGTVGSATSSAAIGQAAMGVGMEPWLHHVQQVVAPTLVLNALESFGPPGAPPLFDEIVTRATARAFADARYVVVPGNHITLLFTEGAAAVGREILEFAGEGLA
ncbi:MAG: alpha/beta hydrolase [Gemmatimonadota bacterium]